MKPVISVVLAMVLATSVASALAQSAPKRVTLANNDCMRIDQINEWHVVDNRTAIVSTGPYQRYLVKLQADCQKLGIGNPGLRFIPSAAGRTTQPGLMCGAAGEKVSSRFQPGCAIQSLTLIDQATFDSYRAKSKHDSVTTQQPSKHP